MLPQIASASSIFDILNEPYIDDINELPYSDGHPSINLQKSAIISGWVDIVGFRNLSKDNTTYYIYGNPIDLAIVQSDVQVSLKHGVVDHVDKNVTFTESQGILTAQLKVKLYWYDLSCSKSGCTRIEHFSEELFQDSEIIPQQAESIPQTPIELTEYRNPIEPKVTLWINQQNLSKITVNYNGSSISHKSVMYHVEQTDKGIYYANKTKIDYWNIEGHGVSRFGNSIIINKNPSNISYTYLNVTISNLYDSQRVNTSSYNISKVIYEPEKVVYNPLLLGFLGIFGIFMYSSYYLIKSVIN